MTITERTAIQLIYFIGTLFWIIAIFSEPNPPMQDYAFFMMLIAIFLRINKYEIKMEIK